MPADTDDDQSLEPDNTCRSVDTQSARRHFSGSRQPLGSPNRMSLTVTDMLRAGVRRRARRNEMATAQSTWDSEGGATERGTTDGKGESVPTGALGLPATPHTKPRKVRPAPRGVGR